MKSTPSQSNQSKEDLQKEKDELDARLNALRERSSRQGAFRSAGQEQQGYLIQQQDAMKRYSDALALRIENFQELPPEEEQEQEQAEDDKSGSRKEGSKTVARKAEAEAEGRHRK